MLVYLCFLHPGLWCLRVILFTSYVWDSHGTTLGSSSGNEITKNKSAKQSSALLAYQMSSNIASCVLSHPFSNPINPCWVQNVLKMCYISQTCRDEKIYSVHTMPALCSHQSPHSLLSSCHSLSLNPGENDRNRHIIDHTAGDCLPPMEETLCCTCLI